MPSHSVPSAHTAAGQISIKPVWNHLVIVDRGYRHQWVDWIMMKQRSNGLSISG